LRSSNQLLLFLDVSGAFAARLSAHGHLKDDFLPSIAWTIPPTLEDPPAESASVPRAT